MASRTTTRSQHWSLALLAGADIPFSILLGLTGALRSGDDAVEEGEQLGLCILRVMACVFALVGGVAAFCATLGASRAGFWRIYVHDRIARARAVALLGALAFHLILDRLSPTIITTTTTTSPVPSISTSSLFNWPVTTSFLALGFASAIYARLYAYFLSQTGWYLKREAALGMFVPESWPRDQDKVESEGRAKVTVVQAIDVVLNLSVASATLLLSQLDASYWMLSPTTLCLLQSTGILLFAIQLPLQLYLRHSSSSCAGNYHNFLIAYSLMIPMRAVVASFSVGLMAWSVMDDVWARECAGGVLVVGESEECRRGLWIRLAPLGVWIVVLAHAALTISALNAYTAFTSHRHQFGQSLRGLNREFCRLARSEGISCRRCRCSHNTDEVDMEAMEDGEFVLVYDAGQGTREVLVRGRNLEAEVAALDEECERGEREVVFSVDGEGEDEDEDRPLLNGPVSSDGRA